MSVKKTQPSPDTISDDELDNAIGGLAAGQINTNVELGKDDVVIQNIGFPDDSGGSSKLGKTLDDKSNVALNPSRTYKKI